MARAQVAHFLNQFFAGRGGEENADHPVELLRGPVGPGNQLAGFLGDRGEISCTIFAGDNFMSENRAEAAAAVEEMLRAEDIVVLVAGPAFASGRYGLACVEACRIAHDLGIPAVTAMHPENPGIAVGREWELVILTSGQSLTEMKQILQKLADVACRLAAGEALGPAETEGYVPRGIRRFGRRELPGHERALKMLKAKLRGDAYTSELSQLQARFVAAPPVADLRQTRLALISTAGLVPKGNPDRMPALRSNRHFVYRLDPNDPLDSDAWESVHAGYNTEDVNRNPNYGLPWKAAGDALADQRVQSLFPGFFSLTGVWTQEPESKTIALNILDNLNAEGVNAAVLVAT